MPSVKMARLGGIPIRPTMSGTVSVWPAKDRISGGSFVTTGHTSGSGTAALLCFAPRELRIALCDCLRLLHTMLRQEMRAV